MCVFLEIATLKPFLYHCKRCYNFVLWSQKVLKKVILLKDSFLKQEKCLLLMWKLFILDHAIKIWMNDPNNIYIGWTGIVFIKGARFPKTASIWANPFKMTPICSRNQVLEFYEEYLIHDPYLMSQLHTLQGKTLGCWCSPEPCHGLDIFGT